MASSTATCTDPNYAQFSNTLQQTPCLVAAYLGAVCNSGQFTVAPLAPGKVYLGPTIETANPCRCSSVFYSLISACSACQEREYLRWSNYNQNCSHVYLGVFDPSIPSGTRVPHWAYLNVSVSDNFDPNAASQNLIAPESTAPAQSTAGSSPPTSTPSSSSTGSSKAGPIAGGVVGGIVGLALIAALVFWWTRRRRARTAPSAEAPYGPSPSAPTPMSTAPLFPAMPPQKLYDPSDPSTFPSATSISGAFNSSSQGLNPNHTGTTYLNSNLTGSTYPGTTSLQNGRYTGAPEV